MSQYLVTLTTSLNGRKMLYIWENITGYLKNHWTKHSLVWIHFNANSMLIPNMGMTFQNCEILKRLIKNMGYSLHVISALKKLINTSACRKMHETVINLLCYFWQYWLAKVEYDKVLFIKDSSQLETTRPKPLGIFTQDVKYGLT